MSIPAGVTRITFGGNLPGGEVWQCGYWIAGATPSSAAEANSLATLTAGTLIDATSGPINLIKQWWDALTTLEQVRVYAYPSGGPAATYVGVANQHVAGTAGARAVGNQTCVVISLRTSLSGRQHRGRMYLPYATAAQLATGQLSTNAQGICDRWALHFNDWNASGDNGVISVVSQVGGGAHVPVSSVQVDGRFDVQRRRAFKQAVTNTYSDVVTHP